MEWSEWLYARLGRTHEISLVRLAELLFEYLTGQLGFEALQTAQTLWRDYQRGGRSDLPEFLRHHLPEEFPLTAHRARRASLKRQARHLALP
jgi:hypothetical protein